jgi:hypothetical protein
MITMLIPLISIILISYFLYLIGKKLITIFSEEKSAESSLLVSKKNNSNITTPKKSTFLNTRYSTPFTIRKKPNQSIQTNGLNVTPLKKICNVCKREYIGDFCPSCAPLAQEQRRRQQEQQRRMQEQQRRMQEQQRRMQEMARRNRRF